MKRATLYALILMLCIIGAFWWSHDSRSLAKVTRPIAGQTQLSVSSPKSPPRATAKLKATKHAKMAGSIRLAPGQTGVLTYLASEPGKTGIVQVTPQMREDGTLGIVTRFMEAADEAITRTDLVADLMPDIFGFDRLTAVDADDLRDFSSTLTQSEQTKIVAWPEMVTRLDSPVQIRSLVKLGDGTPYGGYALSLSARRAGMNDDLDVSISLDTYTPPPDAE